MANVGLHVHRIQHYLPNNYNDIRIMKFLKRRFWTFIELLSENQETSTFSERKRAYSDSVKNGTILGIKKPIVYKLS